MNPLIISIFTILNSVFCTKDEDIKLPYHTAYLQDSCTCQAIHKLSCDSYILPPETRGAGHVVLSRDRHFYREFYCQFTIQAPPFKKVQLMVNSLMLPRTKDCQENSLQIFDGYMDQVNTWPMTVMCGDEATAKLLRSTKNAFTLFYYQGPQVLWDKKQFNITYTFFDIPKLGDPCSNATAEFQCQNKLCISRDLLCDSVDNCEDFSDESLNMQICGEKVVKSNPAVSIGIGGGVFFLLLIIFAISVIFGLRRHRQKYRHCDDVTPNDSPALNISPALITQYGASQEHSQENALPLLPMFSPQDITGMAPVSNLVVPDITRDLPQETRLPSMHLVGIVEIHRPLRSVTPPPSYSALFPDHV